VAFSPDGQTLASGSYDETIRLWDAKTGDKRQTLEGHIGWVDSVAFSPDGQTLTSGSSDKTIRLWDAKTGGELQTLEGRPDSVHSVAFNLHAKEHTATSSASIPQLHDNCDPTSYNINPQISLSNNWVVLAGENLLWLPSEHREFTTSAVQETTIALGYNDGRVSIMGFHTL
jgi:WD40 repeat protein